MKKLTKKEIRKIIRNNYNIGNIINIEEIKRGTADIYLVETFNKKYIFKYFQDKYSEEEVGRESSIINYLNDKIPTPKYLKTINETYYIVYQQRVVIMQNFIDGYTKDKNLGNEKEMLDSAKCLGKIVKELENYYHKYEFKADDWFSLDIDKVISKHQKLLTELDLNDENKDVITKYINKKISIVKNMKKIDISSLDKVSIKFTHGDYSVMQFIYDNDEIKAIIDFISAADMPIVWEVIRSYSYIDQDCNNGSLNIDNLVKYVKEFNKYIKLNKYDLIYMPYIYLIQLIKSTFGYKQYIISVNEEFLEFAIFRTKMADYLFKNAEEISNRLLKEINH